MSLSKAYEIQLSLSPKKAGDLEEIRSAVLRKMEINPARLVDLRIDRRSIDARRKPVRINLKLSAFLDEKGTVPELRKFNPVSIEHGQEVVIVGAGPAGLFAALRLAELGFKPIIVERGKKVSDRKTDIAQLNRNIGLNEDSNYCFGEGGAGTFSDGKLYTRSKKRGEITEVLELLVHFGASPDILIDAHPHIGSDKLPAIIKNIRQAIIDAGGYFSFSSRLTDLEINDGKIDHIVTSNGDHFRGVPMILATGHSARDVYELLQRKKIYLEAKGFAMGVRVEHPQEMIDQVQYHSKWGRGDYLPAAEYSISAQVNKRGVYSFCMCPGGTIVPSSTESQETVVNGMSNALRSSPFANSGLVVEIRESDLKKYIKNHGPLGGLVYQKELETLAYRNGGNGFVAPAQRISDFVRGKLSTSLPECSYHPGLVSSPMHFWLPEHIGPRLQEAFKSFGRRMPGFDSKEGILVGVESRTSSPIRIPRSSISFEHEQVAGFYPCGEGAGYAGGIVSSALDGLKSAAALARNFS